MPYTRILLASSYLYLYAHSGHLLLSVSHSLIPLALSSLAPPPSLPYGQFGTLCQPSNVGGCSPGTHPSHHITRPVNTFSKSVLPYPQLILTNHHHCHYRHRRWAHMTSFVAYIAPNMV